MLTLHHMSKIRQNQTQTCGRMTGFQSFPVNNFKYFLTLFSKFFSSFPHGTCSLSVSPRYLALDEPYHPFRAALPSNSTLRTHFVRGELQVKDGILTLYDTLFQKRIYTWARITDRPSLGYNASSQRLPAFQFELFPLHSPLLGESLLVSLPPLNNMLKFRG